MCFPYLALFSAFTYSYIIAVNTDDSFGLVASDEEVVIAYVVSIQFGIVFRYANLVSLFWLQIKREKELFVVFIVRLSHFQ